MQLTRRSGRRTFAALAGAVALVLAACGQEGTIAPLTPELPSAPFIPPQYRGAAFEMDVSTLRKEVKIKAPGKGINGPIAGRVATGFGLNNGGTQSGGETFSSLLGGDVVDLVASNYQAGALGAVQPNKILITFDLQVNNKLSGADLIVSTWPAPPAGAAGPVLFPFEIAVTTTSGGVSVGGAGNEVIVSSPRFGAVAPSDNWDGNSSPGSGAPHNFFNDVGCTATSNDCFRYEEYAPIAASGASANRQVGFLIDPTVGDFRVRMILAADLRNSGGGPTQSGTVAGTVTSPQIGAISGATVSVSGGFSGQSAAGGAYSIGNVAVGARTVSVTNLPNGCTAPASQSVTVTNGGTSTANFSVVCTTPVGTVTGTVSSSLGGALAGVAVVGTPTGGAASSPFTTTGAGLYTLTLPVGSGDGNISLSNLPANCTNPGATPYTGLTSGGSVTLNITVTCTTPPQVGTVTGTVSSSLGGTLAGATVTIGSLSATTNASGVYTIANAPVPSGNVAFSAASCTAGTAPYAGLASGGSVTVNITLTCTPAAVAYPLSLTWLPITTTGPTGRQVQAELRINMGSAPGNPAINGNAADELVGIQGNMQFNGTLLTYASRALPDPNLDLGSVGSPSAGLVNFAVTSGQSLSSSGNVLFVRMTFNIPTGVSGTVTPTLNLVEVLAGLVASPTNVTSSATIVPAPALTIP